MTKDKLYNNFMTEIVMGIIKYGEDHINIIIDTNNDKMYLNYHTLNNSFNISRDYPLNLTNAVETANSFNIGWSEI